MANQLATRRRMLAAKGRPMLLRRIVPQVLGDLHPSPTDLTVQGYSYPYTPDRIAEPVRQGDAQVQILNDEIVNASWPSTLNFMTGVYISIPGSTLPGADDFVVIDGLVWVIVGNSPCYDGAALIGHSLWVRGGEP